MKKFVKEFIKDFRRKSVIDRWTLGIIYVILLVFVLFVIYPLVYVFIGSFMDPNQLLREGISFNFKDWSLSGYSKVLEDDSIMHAFMMSVFYSTTYAIITTTLSMLLAYPLSIQGLVGRKFINTLILITMFFGGGLVPTYLLVSQLGMLDSIWAILLPGAISAWNIILMRTFFMGLPLELREAAKIDGATEFQYFKIIALPLAKPIIAVIFLYAFVGQWNSYFDAMIYIESSNLEPLQLVLRRILIQNEVPAGMISQQQAMVELMKLSEMIKYAVIVIGSLPLIIMYPFFQKYFEKGVMVGSIKG